MTTILGIDGDMNRIAFCKITQESDAAPTYHIGTVERRKENSKTSVFLPDYADNLRKLLYPILEAGGDICIEAVFLGRNRRTFSNLSKVQGELTYEICAVFGSKQLPKLIMPSTWQAWASKEFGIPFRKPMNTKDAAMLCATKILGYAPSSTHEADATCIAAYGHVLRKNASTTQEETEKIVPRKRKTYKRRVICGTV